MLQLFPLEKVGTPAILESLWDLYLEHGVVASHYK
jgi:hypothetical protein